MDKAYHERYGDHELKGRQEETGTEDREKPLGSGL